MIKDKFPSKIQDIPSQEIKHTKPKVNAEVEKAAKLMEQEFLKEMVAAMRKAVPKSDLMEESMAQKIYEDKMYENYLDQWSNNGGIGLSKIIYDQLIEKYYPEQVQRTPKGQAIPVKEPKTYELDPQQATGGRINKKI